MSKYKQIFQKAFNEMDQTFTSHEFSELSQKYGVPKSVTATGGCCGFLHTVAVQQSRKVWEKKSSTPQITQLQIDVTPESKEEELVKWLISELKSRGYRIMKPRSEWEEI